jgi:hypothetical protein
MTTTTVTLTDYLDEIDLIAAEVRQMHLRRPDIAPEVWAQVERHDWPLRNPGAVLEHTRNPEAGARADLGAIARVRGVHGLLVHLALEAMTADVAEITDGWDADADADGDELQDE